MKYLILFAVLAAAYLIWKHQRQRELGAKRPAARASDPTQGPQDMVRCPVCELHLPRSDAVADAQGRLFCSAEHRNAPGNSPGR